MALEQPTALFTSPPIAIAGVSGAAIAALGPC